MDKRVRGAAAAAALLGCALGPAALAETRIIVQNNTPFAFSSTVMAPSDLRSSAWTIGTTTVAPGQRATVLTFNRDTGVTSGKRFRFRTQLRLNGSDLLLLQELLGSTVNSRMWQSLAGPGFEDAWFDDRRTHRATWDAAGTPIQVQYRAFFTGTDDDVEYVLQSTYPRERGGDDQFGVLAYNIYMRPTSLFRNGQSIRAGLLPEAVRGYDAIVFSEAFDDDVRGKLLGGLKAEYPYATRVVGRDGTLDPTAPDQIARQDGGVLVVSRWPIVAEDREVFRDCAGIDCQSEKGVVYAQIRKGSRTYHVFGTHTQAWPNAEGRRTRALQFAQMKAFVDRKAIASKDAVLIAGDLNVIQRGHVEKAVAGEFEDMLRILNADVPEPRNLFLSWDPGTNGLAEQGKPGEHLDYVLWSKAHRPPTQSSNEVRILRAANEWKEFGFERAYWDLSDHYPVHGLFRFEESPRFDMRTYSGNHLYLVRPDGQLVQHIDAITVDNRSAEERARDASKPPDPREAWQSVVERGSQVIGTAPPAPASDRRRVEGAVTRLPPMAVDKSKARTVPLPVERPTLPPVSVKPIVVAGPLTLHKLSPPAAVGSGWQQFRAVIPAGASAHYAVTEDGRLLWYRHDGVADGAPNWTGPVEVARHWGHYRQVFGGGEGVVYGIAADGRLRWQRHGESRAARTPATWSPSPDVGTGWHQFTHVFGGGGGVIYAIRPDGVLMWYLHLGYLDGSARWQAPKPIGTGWGRYKRVVSAGNGAIYALTQDDRLLYHVHTGWADGSPTWYAPVEVGRVGPAVDLFAALPDPIVVK